MSGSAIGAVVPGLAASLCLLLLAGCTRSQLLATATAMGSEVRGPARP